jgi:alginate O-acetyltransferase complex protein AlgI
MLFSSPVFLFLFLPLVLALYAIAPRALRNGLLLIASLVFYAWDDPRLSVLMLASIGANYIFGLLVEHARDPASAKRFVALAVAANLALLGVFKYWNFVWDNLEPLGLHRWPAERIKLPIGISFFTFQAMSYVIDIYRREAHAQRSPVDFGLYKSLFPQLIAGPIVRYRDVATQILERTTTRAGFAQGVRRFIVGFGKKMLIANVVAEVADAIFKLDPHSLDAGTAWLGTVCYTLQIYFDFSGYSDMAIGLGLMFGFKFLENFDYPYISRSATEFWRRWHISLSSWFRDYLYIPLGGNRLGAARTYFNLLLVFFLCGLWHGAAWNFVVWGLFHGVFLVLERILKPRERRTGGNAFGHVYTMLIVMVAWVFFRADSLSNALLHLRAMFGLGTGDGRAVHAGLYIDPLLATVLVVGAIGSTPWLRELGAWRERRLRASGGDALDTGLEFTGLALTLCVLVASSMMLSAGTYNPFIYFRF